jgi:hypothetical protein
MVELIVDEETAEMLRQSAARENRPPHAVLHSMVEQYTPPRQPSNWPLEIVLMAEADEAEGVVTRS